MFGSLDRSSARIQTQQWRSGGGEDVGGEGGGNEGGSFFASSPPGLTSPINAKEGTPLLATTGEKSANSSNPYWSIYDTPSFTQAKFDWKSVVFTALTIAANAGENISLPLWIEAFGPALGGPYFILLFTSLAFSLVFGVLALLHWVRHRLEVPTLREHWPFFAGIGACDSLNGLLVVYASPPDRTPPLLQALLPSTGIFFSLIFTRVLVARRDSPINYCRVWPMFGLFLVLGGIVLSLFPTAKADVESGAAVFSGGGTILWSLVFILGIAPSAVLAVIQEKFLKRRKRSERESGSGRRGLWFDITCMLFFSCCFQLLFVVSCFWVDILPGYGFSKDTGSLLDTTRTAFGCFFLAPNGDSPAGANCPGVFGLGWVFTFAFVVAYLSGSALNESSANYGNIANTLVSPVVALFWIVFPGLNKNSGTTPLTYVIPALVMLMAGSILWRLYENAEKRKHLPAADSYNAVVNNAEGER
jgi:CRT-like, chloroquine-resistance transporter-like